MEIMVGLSWAGRPEAGDHRVAIDADPGTSGASVAREICAFLGTEAQLSVAGSDIRAMRFAATPLVDGATITLQAGSSVTGASPLPFPSGPTDNDPPSGPKLTVVSGGACGTDLQLSRGSQWLEIVSGVPALVPHAATSNACAHATEIVMDHTDVRIMPGSIPLREDDRLRCGDSWLQLVMPSPDASVHQRVTWPTAPSGDESPARIITVHRATGQGARVGLLLGLLPLVLGVVIAVVTGMWFFMLFSTVGAVVAVVSWRVGRAARTRERARVAAALERDLLRCEEAAPSAAEIVNRLNALDSGGFLASPTSDLSTGTSKRWVRLGETDRPASVHMGDGPGAVPAEHRVAPVLVDVSRVDQLELAVPSRCRAGLLNSLLLQLLTGPGALQQLVVDPDLGWDAPWLPALRVVGVEQHRSVIGPAVEVYSARRATSIPSVEGRIRIVVSVVSDTRKSSGSGLVLSWDSTAILTCDVADAVPGLDAGAGRNQLELHVDTVSSVVFASAMQRWSRVQATTPSLLNLSGLPKSLGSEQILPEPEHIPRLWRMTGRMPSLVAAIGVSRHGVQSLALGDEHPHLLIAGTTGCGKSEVLRTLVAALASRYSPERLEFLFVDFKGGAALAPLTGLPHRSTLLTDLAPEDVRRALEFLRAELRRRERLLAEHGLSDFQGLLNSTPNTEPLVFRELVVVVDEVKMLVDAFSTAGDELAKIATVGRSLGIHLTLATQRPQGAVPADVRANITQAMCLRVRTAQDSADVLGVPAAAEISSATPGRAFLDTDHGAPVEVQTAILTSCASPPVGQVRVRLPGSGQSVRSSRAAAPTRTLESGVARVVADIAQAHQRRCDSMVRRSRPGEAPSPGESTVGPVPDPLPDRALVLTQGRGEVDLGPAENSSEHWTGRATWRPLEDGTLFLIGQPVHTSPALLSALEQLITLRSQPAHGDSGGPVSYVISTTSLIDKHARRWSDAGMLHGIAAVNDPSSIKGMLERLSEGSLQFLAHSDNDPAEQAEPAVLLIEDWDRCCALLRTGPWAYLEDEIIALASAGPRSGVVTVMAGDRSLSVGRASSAGRTRVYFPADQTPQALLQWPRLPAVKPLPQRGVLQGASADRCVYASTHRSHMAHAVIQIPEPRSDGVRTDRPVDGSIEDDARSAVAGEPSDITMTDEISPFATDTSIWPRYRPLPERWTGPDTLVPGLLLGLGTGHNPVASDWGPGSTLLVVGPSRSGRSTYLDSVATSLPPDTVVRSRPVSPEEVERLLSETPPHATVIIDDVDSLGAPVIQRLGTLWQPGAGSSGVGARKDLRLILALRLSDGLPGLFPPLLQWRHVVDTLLLKPRKPFDGDLFGAALVGMPMGGPPGRGYWIHHGVAELVQTPTRKG